MALVTTAIVEGVVSRLSERVIKREGKPDFAIRTFLIVGDHCMANVRYSDRFEAPSVGDVVRCRAAFSTYRDDVEVELDEWL